MSQHRLAHPVRFAALALAAALVACGGSSTSDVAATPQPQPQPTSTAAGGPAPAPTETPAPAPTVTPGPAPTPAPTPTPAATPDRKVTFGTAGPWPLENATYGASQGIQEAPVVGITTDEAQNRWVATNGALYLFAPGASAPKRFTGRDGLHTQDNPASYCENVKGYGFGAQACPILGGAVSPGISTIVGGGPNEVFVGYYGELYDAGPNGLEGDSDDPGRHTGKIDWVRLKADGTLDVVRFDMVSVAHGMQYWHNRTVYRLVYDHFTHPRSLYAGTNHGVDYFRVDRWRPQKPDPAGGFAEWVDSWLQEWMGDHLHAEAHEARCDANGANPGSGTHTCAGESGLLLGDWKGLGLDGKGDLWTAGKWAAGLITWDDSPLNWFQRNGAAFAKAFSSDFGTLPFDPPGNIRDGVDMSAVAVGKDGRVYFASDKQGVSSWKNGVAGFQRVSGSFFGFPDASVADLAALPDGRLAVAHARGGVVLWDPATNDVKRVTGLPSDRVVRLDVDAMVSPPTLHVATEGGAAALRILP